MVQRALGHGLPAVRQAAELLLLRDGSVDASLLAYGTHHIAPADRPVAIAEAMRVVRAGGRIVVHDFDGSSPMAAFFARVVHRHSAAGHEYDHFSRAELTELFRPHPSRLRVIDMYDPFVVRAGTPDAARRALCDYLADMYGVHAVLGPQVPIDDAWGLVEQCFEHSAYLSGLAAPPDVPDRPRVYEAEGRHVAEVPRMAVVAVAEKEDR
jgi:SAM-dependent methyltransferase